MLNSRYVSVSGLDIFRDEILTSSILFQDVATIVPAGTVPSSFITYYSRSGAGTEESPYTYLPADPQPTEAVAANTYWTLGEGSPNDVTRGASVRAITQYVNTMVNTLSQTIDGYIEDTIAPAIDRKVASVTFDNSNKKIYYTNVDSQGNNHDVITFASSGGVSLTAANDTLTISSVQNTAGATANTGNSDLYIIGALTQGANPQTYTRSAAKIDKDGYLYSNGTKVDMVGLATQTYVNEQIAAAIGAAIAASY